LLGHIIIIGNCSGIGCRDHFAWRSNDIVCIGAIDAMTVFCRSEIAFYEPMRDRLRQREAQSPKRPRQQRKQLTF
jgi:hypothetical protein